MLRALSPETRESVVDLLADAFAEDPGYAYAVGGSGMSRSAQRRALFSAEVGLHLSQGQPVFGHTEEGRLLSVALVEAPGTAPGLTALARAALVVLSAAGPWALVRAARADARTHKLRPSERHHTLASLAVAPAEQGRGLARALLDRVHRNCSLDAGSIGIFLETSEPNNIPLYERFGYRVTTQGELGSLRIWGMLRPFQPSLPIAA